jgi:tellurite resistance protein TehA-like permease
MATVAPSTDCRRRAVLTAALSRTSAAVLFLGVVVVGAVASARWIHHRCEFIKTLAFPMLSVPLPCISIFL